MIHFSKFWGRGSGSGYCPVWPGLRFWGFPSVPAAAGWVGGSGSGIEEWHLWVRCVRFGRGRCVHLGAASG